MTYFREPHMRNSLAALVLALAAAGPLSGLAKAADEFYPAEEAAERQKIVWPRLVKLRADAAVLKWPGERSRALRVGDRYRDCELVAILGQPAPQAVLERDFERWGVLAYVGTKGTVATLRKAIGALEGLPPLKAFPPDYSQRIIDAQEDLLGQEVLAHGDEPSYEAVANLLPPLQSYTFLGTTTSLQKVIVWPDGRLGFGVLNRHLETVLFDPRAALGKSSSAGAATKQGLIDRYLPVVDYAFSDPGAQSGWEEIAFATGEKDPETYVCLRPAGGKRAFWKLPGEQPLADGTEFYRALLGVHQDWEQFFSKGMQMDVPEARVNDSSKATIVRALISEVGLIPKDGMGRYWPQKHDNFAPTTMLLSLCLLDWGFTDEAKARLGYYLSHCVKEDGSFDFPGTSVSERGQMLALAVTYVRVTRDTAWMQEHMPTLERIADTLMAEMDASRKQFPPDSPDYGLLWGVAEDDTRQDKRFYFSSDVWCWRGLVELGQLLSDESQRRGDAALGQAGKRMLEQAETFHGIVLAALGRALQEDVTPPFLPPIAGMEKPFGRMTEDRFASYTNYRYWPEMLSAGMLSPEMRNDIIAYRRSHGGEVAGTIRFEDHLDDWPYENEAWGVIAADQLIPYLLGFYGHLAYHQTPGTFTAYEQVRIKGDSIREYSADYCVRAEVVMPQMLRWMVAWEPWDKQELWLARAVPKKWFEEGFSASRIPTQWGPVNLSVAPGGKGMTAQIELASPHPELRVHLRLRPPLGGGVPKITVEGTNNWKWDPSQEAVDLWGAWTRATVNVAN